MPQPSPARSGGLWSGAGTADGELGGSSLNKISCWGEPETWLRSPAPHLLMERPKPLAPFPHLHTGRDLGPWVAEERMHVNGCTGLVPGTEEGHGRDTGRRRRASLPALHPASVLELRDRLGGLSPGRQMPRATRQGPALAWSALHGRRAPSPNLEMLRGEDALAPSPGRVRPRPFQKPVPESGAEPVGVGSAASIPQGPRAAAPAGGRSAAAGSGHPGPPGLATEKA